MSYTDASQYALHMERPDGRTYCGRNALGDGPSVFAHTDSAGEMLDRRGPRCKRCWKAMERALPEWTQCE